MPGNVKFHISDIITVFSGKQISLPDHPPIGPDGVAWPVRYDTFSGTIQLMEHVTGQKISERLNSVTGKPQFSVQDALALAEPSRTALRMQFPELAKETPPEFRGDQRQIFQQIREWIIPLEKKYGAYLEVEPGLKRHGAKEDQRREGRGGWDASQN